MAAVTRLIDPGKIRPPQPVGGRIRRPRILRALRQGLAGRLTLVAAEGGWGKTYALTELVGAEGPLAWCSLDAADADPALLAAHLLAALDVALPGLADRVRDRGPGEPEAVVGQMVEALLDVGQPRVLLVLDDVHCLEAAPAALRLLDALLGSPVPALRVVAAGRRIPAIGSGRLHTQVGVCLLDRETLAFTADEVAVFLAQLYARDLSSREAESLARRVEGWPLALRLLAAGTTARTAREGFWLERFLDHDVLGGLPLPDRKLLMAASLLDRFDAGLLGHILGRDDAAEVLQRLARTSGIIIGTALGDGYLKLHNLLREFLQARAQQEMPAEVAGWHARAGEAWALRDEPWEALHHHLLAGRTDAAAAVLDQLAPALMEVAAVDTVQRLLGQLGAEHGSRPGLLFLRGHLAHRQGRFAEAVSLLEAALAGFRRQDSRPALRACGLSLADLYALLDRWQDMIALTSDLLDDRVPAPEEEVFRLARDSALAMTDRFPRLRDGPADAPPVVLTMWTAYAHYALVAAGRLQAAKDIIEHAAAELRVQDSWGRLGVVVAFLGHTQWEMGQLAAARASLAEAQRLLAERGWPCYASSFCLLEARIAVAAGDLAAAREHLAAAVSDRAFLYRGAFADVVAAVLAAREGDLVARNAAAARARRALAGQSSGYLRAQGLLELAPAYLATQEHAEAATLAGQALSAARATPNRFLQARAHLLRAAADVGLGEDGAAAASLEAALSEAEACGMRDVLLRRESWLLPGLARLQRRLPASRHLDLAPAAPAADEPPQMRVTSLGHLTVAVNGRPVTEWGRRRAEQVFKLLLTAHPAPVARDVLADMLWPQVPPEESARGLNNALSHLRRALATAAGKTGQPWILRSGEAYRLALGPRDFWDVDALRRLEPAIAAGDADAARRIVGLARGEYLAEDRYADWAEPVRREAASALRRSLRLLRKEASARSDWEEALGWAERVVWLDPTVEEDQRHLIALLARAGDRRRALAQYETAISVLRREVGAGPSAEMRTLAADLLAGGEPTHLG